MIRQTKGYRGLKAIALKPDGGYCLIPVRSLLAVWYAYSEGYITLFAFRCYLACYALVARRCKMNKDRIAEYTPSELASLVGSQQIGKTRKAIRQLVAMRLLQWDESEISMDTQKAQQCFTDQRAWIDTISLVKNNNRLLPVPRRMLSLLTRTRSKTLIGTVLGHLLRAMYISKNMCISGGRCKVSWIADVFRLDTRNVKAARRKLIEIGWLQVCESSQLALNRWGLQVIINLHWSNPSKEPKRPPRKAQNVAKTPPLKDKYLSSRSINQKPCQTSGVKKHLKKEKPPSLKHIRYADLTDPYRLDHLYRMAVDKGIVSNNASCRLKWFAAAEHSLSHAAKNPPGLFMKLTTKGLWHFITQAEEDLARAKLKFIDFGEESILLRGKQIHTWEDHKKAA